MTADKWFDLTGWLAIALMAGIGAVHAGMTGGWQAGHLMYGAMAGILVFGLPLVVLALVASWLWSRHR